MNEETGVEEPKGGEGGSDEVVELEEMAAAGKKPPKANKYAIRVDKDRIVFEKGNVTGREILEAAHKVPPEKYVLRQIFAGGGVEKIELDQNVDLTRPGLEKFKTMPRTAQDGQ